MPKKINQTCYKCACELSHEEAEQRECYVGRACISKRSRYRNRPDDLERQTAANLRRKAQGHSRKVYKLPVIGHELPPTIQLILYRRTKESPVHAITAKVWDDGQCIAEVEAQHTMGIHQNRLRATLNQWKAFFQTEYGKGGDVKIINANPTDCPLCKEGRGTGDA